MPPRPVDPGPTTPPPSSPTLGVTRILAFGDSMTEGTTSPTFTPFTLTAGRAESYPFKLQALLSGRYTAQGVEVYNGGRGGETTDQATVRFTGVVSEAKPQAILLMEGANDLNNPVLSLDVTSITGRMEELVKDATGRGSQVFLATIPPQRAGGAKAAAPGLVDKYNGQLRVMAGKKGATLIDVNALLPLSLIGQDGLHPTEAGYQRLAEIWQDAIKAKYEAAPALTVRR
ncbi:MAG: SGNH/GDSL hydrolase family protein [Vicinamibacterales bacterium]